MPERWRTELKRVEGVAPHDDLFDRALDRPRRPAIEPRPNARFATIGLALVIPVLTIYAMISLFGGSDRGPNVGTGESGGEAGSVAGRIIYTKNDGLGWSLYALDPVTGEERRITQGWERDYVSDWSPDGTKVVFDREVGDQDSGGIWVLGEGSSATQVAPHGTFPAWSPDGTTIAFVRSDPGPGHGASIYLMAPDGSNVRPLTSGNVDFSPAWSPDGTKIAFLRHGVGLMAVNADGSGEEQIGDANLVESRGTPDWSPDGTSIVVALGGTQSGRLGGIALIPADGNGDMTFVPGTRVEFGDSVSSPAWSPDASWIAYVRGYPGEIVLVRPDGSGERTIQVDPGTDSINELDWGVATSQVLQESPSAAPTQTASDPAADDGVSVAVLNGTSDIGLATILGQQLQADGYTVGQPAADAPVKPVANTVVYYVDGPNASANAAVARRIADEYFNGKIEPIAPFLDDVVDDDVEVVVVAGLDAAI